jgi:hypothetical protein
MKLSPFQPILLFFIFIITVTCTKNEPEKGSSNKIIITTASATSISSDSAIIGGTISNNGGESISERGICYGKQQNPTIRDNKISSGSGLGTYVNKIVGLQSNTTYYVRTYCLSSQGEVYGNEITFKTLAAKPKITVLAASNITNESAFSGATVLSDGGSPITEKGLCISSIKAQPLRTDTFIAAGTGSSSFAISIPNLLGGKRYYVRAYAKNLQGESYSDNTIQFTTAPAMPPVLASVLVSGITRNVATFSSSITSAQGGIITEYGFCYGTNPIPTINNGSLYSFIGSVKGAFNATPNPSLFPNTTYYVRAYAINTAGGPSYSPSVSSFTTLPVLAPSVSNVSASSISYSSVVLSGTVTDDGGQLVNRRGFYYSSTGVPTTSSPLITDGMTGIGNFSVALTGLLPNTTYFFKAFGSNTLGGIGLATNTLSFKTLSPSAPTVTTISASSITSTSFISGGNISNDGGSPIIQKGICWNTTGTPVVGTASQTNNGSGLGIFTSSTNSITALLPNTTYYVRAYAMNGGPIGYGNQITVTTSPGIPTLVYPINGVALPCCYPTFSWNAVGGATSYEIQIAKNNTFTNAILNLSTCNATPISSGFVNRITSSVPSVCIGTSTSANNGTWYWRVRAISGTRIGTWSNIGMFNYTF